MNYSNKRKWIYIWMFTHFTDIVNGLKALGRDIKILSGSVKSLPPPPPPPSLKELGTNGYYQSGRQRSQRTRTWETFLFSHNLWNDSSSDVKRKKKDLALNVSPLANDNGDLNDKEMVLLPRKFKQFLSEGENVWQKISCAWIYWHYERL